MSASAITTMLNNMQSYFTKVKAVKASIATRYSETVVPANGGISYDPAFQLGFVAADYHLPSMGIEIRINDPAVSTNPPIITAEGVITYSIDATTGVVTVKNTSNAPIRAYLRVTMPVKK